MTKVTSDKLVDIVIPVHNRLEHTKQTLESLLKNTDPNLYQLYVIDDLSTDGTREYLQKHDKIVPIFFNDENIGPGPSRNKVCSFITQKELRSEYLYHSDNDVFFTEGWLEKLINAYEDYDKAKGNLKLLGGGCHPYLQNNSRYESTYAANAVFPYSIGMKDAVSGYSQLMTWETWDKYGPFDESMRGQERKIMGSEDWAFCQKIIKDGFLVGSIEPEVVIATGKTNTYGDLATGSETFKEAEGVKVI